MGTGGRKRGGRGRVLLQGGEHLPEFVGKGEARANPGLVRGVIVNPIAENSTRCYPCSNDATPLRGGGMDHPPVISYPWTMPGGPG